MSQLNSPGVRVTVTDESFFAGAGEGTIPLVVFATQSNKGITTNTNTTLVSTNIAPGTVPAEAGKLRLITSQRELIQTYGEPIFLQEAGTPLHGNELNEYGLHAVMQYLGIADRAFVIRADVPLEELTPSDTPPVGPPANGTYWFDLANTEFGVFQGDGTKWNHITPSLFNFNVSGTSNVSTDPSGNDGDFAIDIGNNLLGLFEKIAGTWFRVGTTDWITAKGTTNLVGGGTGPATLTYAPHTGIVPTNVIPLAHDQHIWVKTTTPNQGADYKVKLFNGTTQIFTEQFTPLFDNDTEADTFFGPNRVAGSLYVNYDTTNATHVIKRFDGTNWLDLVFEAKLTPPTSDPVAGTLWYSTEFKVDIMASDGSNWFGYVNRFPNTDPNGVILSGTAPITQSDGSTLVDNDLWIDTTDLENYPKLSRWVSSLNQWVLVDKTDQTTPDGIVFADAREIGGVPGLTSNTLDADAPDPKLFPAGMLLFNTRYSTLNVKSWTPNYTFEGNLIGDRWVSVSGLQPDGSPFMGRKAQRRVIVKALQEVFASNQEIRSEFRFFNLIACPGYPDVIDEMILLNTDIKEVAFIVGDTPIRLAPDGQSIIDYAQNLNNVALNGEDGRTSGVRNFNVGQWYPWGLGTNLDGAEVMIPPSTMALRTIAFSDQISFPWFAPAGFQRGLVTNAQSVGYLTAEGEFQSVILNPGQRDTLYLNNINPISAQPNRGLVVLGQKTLNPVESALDRINVARLVNFLRFQLEETMKPFLFEPNDSETRESVTITLERFLSDLLGKRALFDFGVRCDETNNTPDRIDRNELWADVAIKPTKSVEFIFVPIRILNTGDPLPAA